MPTARSALLPVLLLLALTAWAAPGQAQDWPTPAGHPTRTRAATLPLEGPELVPTWTLPTPGRPSSMVVADIDGDPDVEIVIVAAGRARAYRPDGSLEWVSAPLDLQTVLPPVDLDANGRPELVFMRNVAGIAVLNGLDGSTVFQSQLEDLSKVGRVLVRDLDGDAVPELIASEYDCGPNARWIGRTVAYSMLRNGAGQLTGEVMRLADGTRDYNCNTGMATANLDGTGRPEIIAVGTKVVYVYSGTDGQLVDSLDVGNVPYGRATPYVADIDADGRDEILFVTNNGNPLASRRAFLVERDDDGNLVRTWQHGVTDLVADQHVWPAEPLVDLDDDGDFEVVHALYDAASQSWTTYVRDAASGSTEYTIAGRVHAVGPAPSGAGARIYMENIATSQLEVRDAAGALVGTLPGDALTLESAGYASSGRTTTQPLVDARGWLYSVDLYDTDRQQLGERTWRALDPANGSVMQSFTVSSDDALAQGRALDGAVWFALSTASGLVEIRDGSMNPTNLGDDGLPNIETPSQDASAVLTAGSGADLRVARGSSVFDVSAVNLATPATVSQLDHVILGLTDLDDDGIAEAIGLVGAATTDADLAGFELDGTERWTRDGLTTESVRFYKTVLGDDLDGDGVFDVLLQQGNYDTNNLTIVPLSGATGLPLWEAPASGGAFAASGATNPISWVGAAGPRVAFGPSGNLRLLDGTDGAQLATWTTAIVVDPTIALVAGAPSVIANALLRGAWYAISPAGSTLWEQRSIQDANAAAYRGGGVAFVDGPQTDYLVEGRAATTIHDHNLAVLDAATGQLVHRVNLEGGQAGPPAAFAATVSTRAPVAVGAGTAALVVVGANDGWVYLLDLDAAPEDPTYPGSLVVRAFNLGAPVGDVSAADVDADGTSEVLVPTLDGRVVILDVPGLEADLKPRDIDCDAGDSESAPDLDEVSRVDVFCAAWTPALVAVDGYVATLVDTDTGSAVAGPQPVTGPFVRFEGLSLGVGRTYHVEIQAWAGSGPDSVSSDIHRSDGAVVVTALEPPEVTLTVEPDMIVVLQHIADIEAVLHDDSRLASWTLTLTAPDGRVLLDEGGTLNAVDHTVERDFDGLDPEDDSPLPVGTYLVRATALDFDGLEGSAEAPIYIVDELPLDVVELDGDDVSEPDADIAEPDADVADEDPADTGADTSQPDPDVGGMGDTSPAIDEDLDEGHVPGCCSTVRAAPEAPGSGQLPWTLAVSLLIGLAWLRRRR